MSGNISLKDKVQAELAKRELARRNLYEFTEFTMPEFQGTDFHRVYYTILDLFAKGLLKKLMVTMPPQHGKALQVDTPVLTTRGWKTHSTLKPGDYVFGETGKPVKVIEVHPIYNLDTSRVKMSTGESLIASNNHEWIVYCNRESYRKKGRKIEKLETKDLLLKQRRNPAIKSNIVLNTTTKKLPIDPYILGCWLGDGLSRQGVLTVNSGDIDHFKSLGKCTKQKNNVHRILIEGLSKELRLNNLILNKHIPEIYLKSSVQQRLRLLQGIMDTDGYCDDRGRCEISQVREELSKQIYQLLRSLGIKPSFKKTKARYNGRVTGPSFRMHFSTTKRVFTLPRKYNKLKKEVRSDASCFFIKTVEPVGKNLVNCITVEGGVYLAGKNLILTHNSEGSSRRLPSFIHGKQPNKKIAILSYAATFAQGFNRDNQRIISSNQYKLLFPNTRLPGPGDIGQICNSTRFDIAQHKGFLKTVGRGGALTGDPVDIAIMDDLYRDSAEGNSPIIRNSVIEWYTSVVMKRLHNDSQQLIVFTRWHEEDLIGWIEEREEVITLDSWDQLKNIDPKKWYKINFPALMNKPPTELDPRQEIDEPLYPEKHSKDKLITERTLDPQKFESMNQGDPAPKEGLLYQEFKTWKQFPKNVKKVGNYTDTADRGDDYLCSINYVVSLDNYVYITDVYYTQDPQEVTEPGTADLLKRGFIREAVIESNNGGRGFARSVDRILKHRVVIKTFHQSDNKESRILTNSAEVQRKIIFPDNWDSKFPQFYKDLTRFKRQFNANKHDDAPDCVTGVLEYSGVSDTLSDALYRR